MVLSKCPICSSRSSDLSNTWPDSPNLTKLPFAKWVVDWYTGKAVHDKCCLVCATVIAIFVTITEFHGVISREPFGAKLGVHVVDPGQRYLLTLGEFPGFDHDGIYMGMVHVIFNPPNSSLRGTYVPCGEIPVNSGSLETLALARTWLNTCRTKHSRCIAQTGRYIPTRLLDVNQDNIKLVLRGELEASEDDIKYVALSHRWGETQPLKTLKSNIDRQKGGIPDQNLPATFKDAVKVVRSLGLRYIWIDSLCIIQDDNDDWIREAEQMERVYGDAELVLAAAAASSTNDGFLRDRPSIKGGRINFHLENVAATLRLEDESDLDDYRSDDEIYLGDATHLYDGSSTTVKTGLIQCDYRIVARNLHSNDSPLDHRAWAYQERLLARRYLLFGQGEIRWECLGDSCCECGWISIQQPTIRRGLILENMFDAPPSWGIHLWRSIIRQYSERVLTVRSDKLVALSAVASRFQSKYNCTYLAGLQKEDLVPELLWCLRGPSYGPVSPEIFYAPSWSWASIDISNVDFLYKWLEDLSSVDIVSASARPSTTNPFGPVSSGIIQLRGKLIPSTARIDSSETLISRIQPFETDVKWNCWFLDPPLVSCGSALDPMSGKTMASARRIKFCEKDIPREVSAVCLVWLLPLIASRHWIFVLVLGLSPSQPGCFERLGCGSIIRNGLKPNALDNYNPKKSP